MIWGVPFQSANHILNRILIAAGREGVFIKFGLAALATNIALNVLLIPRFSYYGASVATVVCLAQSMALHLWALGRTEYRLPLRRALLRPLAALVSSWLVTLLLLRQFAPAWSDGWFDLAVTEGWVPFAGGVVLWGLCYLAAVIAWRVLDREDVRLLQQLLRRGD